MASPGSSGELQHAKKRHVRADQTSLERRSESSRSPLSEQTFLKPCLGALSPRRFAWAEETRGPNPKESAQGVAHKSDKRCEMNSKALPSRGDGDGGASAVKAPHTPDSSFWKLLNGEKYLIGTRLFMLSSALLPRLEGFTLWRLVNVWLSSKVLEMYLGADVSLLNTHFIFMFG